MPRVFSIAEGDEDLEEKLHLLETKIQTLEVLLHDVNSAAASTIVDDKSGTEEEDEENAQPSSEETTRHVSFSDVDEDIPHKSSPPNTPSTTYDDEDDGFIDQPRGLFWHSSSSRPGFISEQSVINEEVHDADYFKELNEDTFTLMILSEPLTKQWFFGVVVFSLQISLLLMILVEMYGNSKDSTPLDVPYKVDPVVQAGQLLAIIVSLATQTDLVTAIITFMMLWIERRAFWTSLIKVPENSSLCVWFKRIAFPISCMFIGGLLVLCCTFIIVITSDSVIDLFKDYAAMQVISELDNMMFWLALNGYIGKDMAHGAKQARKIKIHDKEIKTLCGIPFRTIILMFIFSIMGGGWGYFIYGQITGRFFAMKYPHCEIPENSKISYMDMGNKICNGPLNNIECGFDDGDCIAFNLGYPNCRVAEPTLIGNGECNQDYNSKECNFDGGDCCPVTGDYFRHGTFHGDGICNGGIFNSEKCDFDGGDCKDFNKKYGSTCEILDYRNTFYEGFDFYNDVPPGLGDGKCNGGTLNNKDCGYDGGDCVKCNEAVPDPSMIGDGHCDGGIYMDLDDCNLDGGDCADFKESYPHCFVPHPEKIGDGICDGFPYFSVDCYYDGDDCSDCDVPNRLHVGDGWCDGGAYMSEECGNDGGDCSKCIADPDTIGNGVCDLRHNTTECSWDGGDCLEGGRPVVCNVTVTGRLGDWICDGGEYNTKECSWDGGDCSWFNHEFPNCDIKDPQKLGDGNCDGAEYNTEDCRFDDGDCEYFNDEYPNCDANDPESVGDGHCDVEYNTLECSWDGGDCVLDDYPNCHVERPDYLGDGVCDGGEYNKTECGFDGSDCIGSDVIMNMTTFRDRFPDCDPENLYNISNGVCDYEYNIQECDFDGGDCDDFNDFNDSFPDCDVDTPSLVGDGNCDGGEYNTEECEFDGGDCDDFNEFNEAYPDCGVDNPEFVEDGYCDGGEYNTEECRFDGGDCDDFNEEYPDCDVDTPSLVGDGYCDGGEYNTEDCGFDGGDCEELKKVSRLPPRFSRA